MSYLSLRINSRKPLAEHGCLNSSGENSTIERRNLILPVLKRRGDAVLGLRFQGHQKMYAPVQLLPVTPWLPASAEPPDRQTKVRPALGRG